MRITLLATALLVAFVAAPAYAAPPKIVEDDEKFVLENGFVSVWFQDKSPKLKVLAAAGDNVSTAASYEYTFTDLVEYRDVDANGVVAANEVVARLDLASGVWEAQRIELEDVVILNLTLEAPVALGKDLLPGQTITLPDRNARLSLVFTLRSAAATLDADGVNVSVPASSIKYDVLVEKWPFVDADAHRLALQMDVGGNLEFADATGVESADVVANGTTLGSVSWTTVAAATTTDGADMDVPVRAVTEDFGEGRTRLTFTYDAPDIATLVHDPTVGVAPTPEALEAASGLPDVSGGLKDVPVGGGAVALAAAVGAAILARRR